MTEFDRLFEVIKTLRGENGCPWDKKQTVRTMPDHILEEAYEVVEGIDGGSDADLKEEIGDLLFLCVFVSYIAEQEGRFTVEDAVRGVADKLVRRHPHVFADREVNGVGDVLKNWEAIKMGEEKNKGRKSPFDGIPKAMPDLQRFDKVLQKLEREGVDLREPRSFGWEDYRLEDEFAAMNGRFDAETVRTFVKKLLVKSYAEGIDVASGIRKDANEIIRNYEKNNVKP